MCSVWQDQTSRPMTYYEVIPEEKDGAMYIPGFGTVDENGEIQHEILHYPVGKVIEERKTTVTIKVY